MGISMSRRVASGGFFVFNERRYGHRGTSTISVFNGNVCLNSSFAFRFADGAQIGTSNSQLSLIMNEIKIGDRFHGGSTSYEAKRPCKGERGKTPTVWRVLKTVPGAVRGHEPEMIEMATEDLLSLRYENLSKRGARGIRTIGTWNGERMSHRKPANQRSYGWNMARR